MEATGFPRKSPPWFNLPAMMRFTITTSEVLKILQARERDLPYRDRTKPFNFIQSPILDAMVGHPLDTDPESFMLIAPFTSDPLCWYELTYVNVHDGKQYKLGRPGKRLNFEAEPTTYGDALTFELASSLRRDHGKFERVCDTAREVGGDGTRSADDSLLGLENYTLLTLKIEPREPNVDEGLKRHVPGGFSNERRNQPFGDTSICGNRSTVCDCRNYICQ
jgi:hypothetical protein